MSSYRTTADDRVWVITEGDRFTTILLLPMSIDFTKREKKEKTK